MYTYSQLLKFCTLVFVKLGMDEDKAADTSEILIEGLVEQVYKLWEHTKIQK